MSDRAGIEYPKREMETENTLASVKRHNPIQ